MPASTIVDRSTYENALSGEALTSMPHLLRVGNLLLHRFIRDFGHVMNVNTATQEGDHGCYHYMLIYGIKPNLEKYLSNMNEFN